MTAIPPGTPGAANAPLQSRLFKTLFCLAVLAGVGWVGSLMARPAWSEVREAQPALRQEALADAMGQGLLIGLFGGFRSLLADFSWLRTSFSWLERDVDRTRSGILMTTQIDPRPFYFWMQGARILAYDMPKWRLSRADPPSDPQAIRREQAFEAIGLLYRSAAFHPREPWVWIEIAQIYHNVLKDPLAAAEYFGKAAAMPNAPFFAGRLHGELLRRAGRPEAAYAFYRQWYPQLPADNPLAAREVVRDRIRELERELGVPESRRYDF